MKKFLTLVVALVLTIPMMAIGTNDGSTKANAIDFDWDKGVTHTGGTKWYRVPLAPLYEEENPSLTLYLTNPSNVVGSSVDVSMQATVAGQSESKDYTIAARQYKSYTANASMLVRMKQTEIYLTLTSKPKVGTESTIKLSAKVFEAADLDETCKDARTLTWGTEATQAPMYSAWWKVSLKPIKDVEGYDAQITITNTGSKTVNLKVGQSLDCPSSGMTKREYTLAPNEPIVTKVPRDMIVNVQPDELYFGIENVESQISIKVEKVAQPPVPIISGDQAAVDLHVKDTLVSLPVGTTLYKISVADMNALAKYEPEFTYRNAGSTPAKVSIKMAFKRPAFSTSDVEYDLGAGEEEIVVYKKNMLDGMDGVDSIYLLTTVTGTVNFYGRFKHVREGKACKTNIDFNWETGHSQDARTTQWYAINVADARDHTKDIMIYVLNQGNASATVKASMAFSCPYIDLQEITRTIAANSEPLTRRMGYSSYAMMSDTVWIGLETNQDIRFWADTVDAEKKPEPDSICLQADTFNWKNGVLLPADTTMWYVIDMTEVDTLAAKFPTVVVQNLSNNAAAKITAELSLECPDEIANQSRSITIAAGDSYSKQISSNMFKNIVSPEIYLKVRSTQAVSLQIRLNEEAEGSSCSSAIPFNWVSGHSQKANDNLWYSVDLRDALTAKENVLFKVENKDNAEGEFIWKISKTCSKTVVPSIERFQIGKKGLKEILKQYASLKDLEDSVIYIGLEGTTALRFYAESVPVAPIDTIHEEDVTISEISIDNGAAITPADSVEWYQLKAEDIQLVRDSRVTNPQTLAMHFVNTSAEAVEVVLEIAYAFPVTEAMLQLSYTVPAGASLDEVLNWAEFNEKLADNDNIYVRVTIPSAAVGQFSVTTELVDAFDGASREEAVPLVIGKRYEQPAMTDRWYKLNTADLKLDSTMYNKVLYVATKNIGTSNATINAAVYEGLLSNADMLYGYLDAESGRSRTVKPGQGKSHNIPAQALYAVGDVELYIWVRTTGKLMFETKFNGTYAKLSDEQIAQNKAEQEKATLVVPNVDYYLPANETKWFRVCAPYILNNYVYTDNAKLEYEFEGDGPATVTVTATLQDVMTYDMPVRTRTIDFKKRGIERKGNNTLLYMMNRVIKHFDANYGVPTLPEHDIDSLLRKFIVSPEDSITGYLRVSCDKPVHLRLNMKHTTGDACDAPMMFDWEHGNVNPAGKNKWYLVKLADMEINGKDTTFYPYIPKECDLRLHVDNWASDSSRVSAGLYFDCNDPATVSKTYKQGANGKDTLDIDRDLLVTLGWSDMIIDFNSEKATHIWAELIPEMKYDTLRDTIRAYVCQGEYYIDSIRGKENYKKIQINVSKEWNDTLTFRDGPAMRTRITKFEIHPLVMPEALTVDSMKKLGAAPLLVQGMQLFVDSSSIKLTEYYRNLGNKVDTITRIDTVYWAKPVYDAGVLVDTVEAALDTTSFYQKTDTQDNLLLVIVSDTCGFTYRTDLVFSIDDYKYVYNDTTLCPDDYAEQTENPKTFVITVDTLGRQRYVDSIVTYKQYVWPTMYTKDALSVLPDVAAGSVIDTAHAIEPIEQLLAAQVAAQPLTMPVTKIQWQVQGITGWEEAHGYKVQATDNEAVLRYVLTTPCGDTASVSMHFDLTCKSDTAYWTLAPLQGCDSVTWNDGVNDHTFYKDTTYYHDAGEPVPNSGCRHYIEVKIDVLNSSDSILTPVKACDSYYWADASMTITTLGKHTYTWKTVNDEGCDSILSLDVTIYKTAQDSVLTDSACNYYDWRGVRYAESGTYYDSLKTVGGNCDSVFVLNLKIKGTSYVDTLDIKAYYGNRIIMINRNQINELPGWEDLDSLDNVQGKYVWWYKMVGATPDITVDEFKTNGYYYTLDSGDPLPAGDYYAYIDLPRSAGAECGSVGMTKVLPITASAAASPALVPSLARPGEDIRIINLDPEVETNIRIYSAEGLLQKTYKSYGETSFTIKASNDNGFYIVELNADSMKSTLRYIVK